MCNIKIFVSCHEDSFVPKSKILIPIQVGSALTEKRFEGMCTDNTGENISHKNRCYCELTAHYWAWKNVKADYYGFYHYRRYISMTNEVIGTDPVLATVDYLTPDNVKLIKNTDEDLMRLIPQYDVITVRARDLGDQTIFSQYESEPVHEIEDLNLCLEIIREKYPQYYNTAFHYWNSNFIYYCNMYIMKKEIFEEYSSWLFDILEEFLKRKEIENYSPAKYRVMGYLAERLFGVYYQYIRTSCTNLRCIEMQRIHIKYTHRMELYPSNVEKRNIPIVLTASEYFLPFVNVLLHSIMDNSNSNYFYDVIIFHNGLSPEKQMQAQKASIWDNFSLRFLDISPAISSIQFKTRNHVSVQTWFRTIAPFILPQYSKILYLDSDMIVNDDISKLFDISLDDKIIAATRDMRVISSYYTFPRRKDYCENYLKLNSMKNYFQAGLMVINLDIYRAFFTFDQVIEQAIGHDWELMDQDMLNSLIPSHMIHFLDQRWNTVADFQGRCESWLKNLPHELYDNHMDSLKNPAVIHYGGPYKPWSHEDIDEFALFWKNARKSDYYEYIIMRSISEKTKSKIQNANRNNRSGFFWRIVDKLFPFGSSQRRLVKKILLRR